MGDLNEQSSFLSKRYENEEAEDEEIFNPIKQYKSFYGEYKDEKITSIDLKLSVPERVMSGILHN